MARKAMKEHEKILVHLLTGESVSVASLKSLLPSEFNWNELYKYVARMKLRCGGIVAMTKVGKEIVGLQLTNPEKFKVGQTGPRWSEAFTKLIYGDTSAPVVASKPVKVEKPIVVKPAKTEKVAKVKVEDIGEIKSKVKSTSVSDVVVDPAKLEDYGSKVMDQIRAELAATKPTKKEDKLVVKAASKKKKTPMDWAMENKHSPRSINEAPAAEPVDWDNIKWTKGSLAVDKEFDNIDISDVISVRSSIDD